MIGASLAVAVATSCAPTDEVPDTPDASVDASNDVATTACDPTTDPCAPLERSASECRFSGTPPGGLPQLTLVDAELSLDGELVGATQTAAGPAFALANGRVVDSSGSAILDLGRRPLAIAAVPDSEPRFVYSAVDGDDLLVGDATGTGSTELFRIPFEGSARGGGIAVDADRILYVGIGDDDSEALDAQDATSWYGAVLRVQLGEAAAGYEIPEDNPFDGTNGAPEVYATGLHDPGSIMVGHTRILVTDRGVQVDEVNSVTARANFGWPYLDGTYCRTTACAPQRYQAPFARHERGSDDCRLVGGGQFPADYPTEELAGVFLYAGSCDRQLHGLRVAPNGRITTDVLALASDDVVAFAGPDLMLSSETVRRVTLADDAASAMFPTKLSESGCFDLTSPRPEAAPGVIPYFVRSPLWTDGAVKRRFMVLPSGTTTTVDESGHLEFPAGSLLLKEFAFDFGDPTPRPVELRVMRRNARTWSFFTYRFDDGGSDATIVDGKDEAVLDVWIDDEPSTVEYLFPDSASCRTCHSSSRRVLGPRLDQLAGPLDYGVERRDQLAELARLEVVAPVDVEPLPDPADPAVPIAQRARAYLDANCGHCHRPGGWVPPDLTLDLRYSTSAAEMNACGVRMQYPSPFVTGDYRIVPGSPDESALFQRMQTRGLGQMPLLATSLVDPLATDVIATWIRDMSCEIE